MRNYNSNKIRKTQNEHLIFVCQNLILAGNLNAGLSYLITTVTFIWICNVTAVLNFFKDSIFSMTELFFLTLFSVESCKFTLNKEERLMYHHAMLHHFFLRKNIMHCMHNGTKIMPGTLCHTMAHLRRQ